MPDALAGTPMSDDFDLPDIDVIGIGRSSCANCLTMLEDLEDLASEYTAGAVVGARVRNEPSRLVSGEDVDPMSLLDSDGTKLPMTNGDDRLVLSLDEKSESRSGILEETAEVGADEAARDLEGSGAMALDVEGRVAVPMTNRDFSRPMQPFSIACAGVVRTSRIASADDDEEITGDALAI